MTIVPATVSVDRKAALGLYRDYKKHQHYSTPMDAEIRRAYQLIAQGKMIIDARASIIQSGLGEDGLPKLAIGRATVPVVWFQGELDGRGVFRDIEYGWNVKPNHRTNLPAKSFPFAARVSGKAALPPIPIHLRPKRGLENYHVLWEAMWQPVPPVDPLLLRRIGKSDMWLVVAAWDLTPIERAAMSSRITQ